MKTAISIPDKVFNAAEKLAARLGVSRSQLYANAVADYLARHRVDRLKERLDDVYSTQPSEPDAVLTAMQRTSISADEW